MDSYLIYSVFIDYTQYTCYAFTDFRHISQYATSRYKYTAGRRRQPVLNATLKSENKMKKKKKVSPAHP